MRKNANFEKRLRGSSICKVRSLAFPKVEDSLMHQITTEAIKEQFINNKQVSKPTTDKAYIVRMDITLYHTRYCIKLI